MLGNSLKFTLVTPVLNGAKFLRQTLASVRGQAYANLEYIVCDGGSTDGSREILAENSDIISRLIVGKDRSMYDALMKGFALATGDIMGWINSDDLLMPWCLSCVATYFQRVPECDWLTGVPALYDPDGRLVRIAQIVPRYRRKWIARGWYSSVGLGPIQQESTFFRRSLFQSVGGLNTNFRQAGDFDLWRRFARHASLHQIGTVISGFRVHGSNLTANPAEYWREARAVRIPAGKLLGATYSFLSFLWDRLRKRPRLDAMLLGGLLK